MRDTNVDACIHSVYVMQAVCRLVCINLVFLSLITRMVVAVVMSHVSIFLLSLNRNIFSQPAVVAGGGGCCWGSLMLNPMLP